MNNTLPVALAATLALASCAHQPPATQPAVLARVSLPIADVTALTPGQELALPYEVLDRIALEGADGRVVARGRLGQARGHRALRITVQGEDAMDRAEARGAATMQPFSDGNAGMPGPEPSGAAVVGGAIAAPGPASPDVAGGAVGRDQDTAVGAVQSNAAPSPVR